MGKHPKRALWCTFQCNRYLGVCPPPPCFSMHSVRMARQTKANSAFQFMVKCCKKEHTMHLLVKSFVYLL